MSRLDAGWFRTPAKPQPVTTYRLTKENAPRPRKYHHTFPTYQPRDSRDGRGHLEHESQVQRFIDLLPLQHRNNRRVYSS
jgi:hypothetical protein